MRKVCLMLFLFIHYSSSAQDKNYSKDIFPFLEVEVKSFIDTIKNLSIANGKYNVYTVDVYNTYPDTNSLCFIVSYFYNRRDYYSSTLVNFFDIGNDIVLLRIPEDYTAKLLNKSNFRTVDTDEIKSIKNKLAPNTILHHGENEKSLIWWDRYNIKRKFCEDPWGNPKYESSDFMIPVYTIQDFAHVKAFFSCESATSFFDCINKLLLSEPMDNNTYTPSIPIPISQVNRK